ARYTVSGSGGHWSQVPCMAADFRSTNERTTAISPWRTSPIHQYPSKPPIPSTISLANTNTPGVGHKIDAVPTTSAMTTLRKKVPSGGHTFHGADMLATATEPPSKDSPSGPSAAPS